VDEKSYMSLENKVNKCKKDLKKYEDELAKIENNI
jgi:hypothetical protein